MREVKSQDWPAFCARVNANEVGGTISVHKVDANGVKREIAEHATFQAIEHGKRDDCNDHIVVRLSGTGEHEIVEPIRLQLMETENGAAFQSVIVEAEDGVTTLAFRPVIKAAWLTGFSLV